MRVSSLSLSDRIKWEILQAVVELLLLYSYAIWTLTKHLWKKVGEHNTRTLSAILNKF